jgi:hypothetical protein
LPCASFADIAAYAIIFISLPIRFRAMPLPICHDAAYFRYCRAFSIASAICRHDG